MVKLYSQMTSEEFAHEARECRPGCALCIGERLTEAEESLIRAAIDHVARLGLKSGRIVEAVEAVRRERER